MTMTLILIIITEIMEVQNDYHKMPTCTWAQLCWLELKIKKLKIKF